MFEYLRFSLSLSLCHFCSPSVCACIRLSAYAYAFPPPPAHYHSGPAVTLLLLSVRSACRFIPLGPYFVCVILKGGVISYLTRQQMLKYKKKNYSTANGEQKKKQNMNYAAQSTSSFTVMICLTSLFLKKNCNAAFYFLF